MGALVAGLVSLAFAAGGAAALFLAYAIESRLWEMPRSELFSLIFAGVGLACLAVGLWQCTRLAGRAIRDDGR